MRIGVISNLMSAARNASCYVRIRDHVFPDEEKGSVDTILLQHVHDLIGVTRVRAIVKGQRDLVSFVLVITVDADG